MTGEYAAAERPARPLVSIVLLSYARPAMLGASLRAARAQGYAPCEIIVVDNESEHSDEIARLVRHDGDARLVRTGANLGFATGMNRGLQEARGELVLLTEDDMVLDPDAVERFVRAHERVSGPAMFTGVIRDRDSGTTWFAGGNLELSSVFSLRLLHRGSARPALPPVSPTSYITGAFVFGPLALLRDLGAFREEYFMYFEDVELSLRAAREGIALLVVADAGAEHFTPDANARSALLDYHKVKNLLATYLLHAPARVLPAALLRYGVLDTMRSIVRGRQARPRLRAVLWITLRLPRLLAERWLAGRGKKPSSAPMSHQPR